MKIGTRILSLVLACIMVFTAAPQVFADTFNVGTADDILNNWNTTFNDTFNMTDNIDMGGSTLDANMYHSYTINGNGHTLSNVSIGSEAVFGEPDVTINANVTGTDDTALEVSGNVEVTVNGNVTSNNNNYTALSASDGAEVTVNNVTKTNGNGDAVLAIQGSTVTVKQDVTLDSNLSRPSSSFAVAAEDSTVTVKDDVTSDQYGILASGEDTKVTVGDDVTVDSKFGTSSGSALNVHDGADTTIGGDVESSNMSHIRNSSTVTIKGDYTSDKGLNLYNGNVTVNGDVAVGDQTYLDNSSTLTVNGSYTSDEEGFDMSGSTLTVKGDVTTNGQTVIQNHSDVKIYGDFTGQPATGVTMEGGIHVSDKSQLYMGDGTTLETDQLHIFGDSEVDAAFVEANAVTVGVVGAAQGIQNDKSQFFANGITCDTKDSSLSTSGSTVTTIIGHVEDIYADENSRVDVYGNAKKVVTQDNAVVTTNISTKSKTYYTEPAASYDYVVGNTTANTIIKMCKSFANGSELFKQWDDLSDLMTVASVDITNKLDLPGAALKTALFDYESINQSNLSTRSTDTSIYYNENYNQTSMDDFKKATELSPYLINKYKDNLATAMADLNSKKLTQDSEDDLNFMKDLVQCSVDGVDALKGVNFTGKELVDIKDILEDNVFSVNELVAFLKKHRFKEEDFGVILEAQRIKKMTDMVTEVAGDIEFVSKVLGTGMTIYDILEPVFRDYSRNVEYLDYMLATQPLEPELFAAAVELKDQMEKAALAVIDEFIQAVKSKSIDAIKGWWGPLKAGQAVIDVIGFVTGSTKYATTTQNGAALCCMVSEIFMVYENSINAVKMGDTSENAVQMVYTSYSVLKTTLEEMCEVMETLGTKKEREAYKSYLKKLENMDLGEYVEIVEYRG